MAENETADIKMSTHSVTRKNLDYLQKQKEKGEKLVQMCPAELGPFFAMAAEMVGCDICRIPHMISARSGTTFEEDVIGSRMTVKKYREYTKTIHINFYMPIGMYADKVDAFKRRRHVVFCHPG